MFKKFAFLLCCFFICCSHIMADDFNDSWIGGYSPSLDVDSFEVVVNPVRFFMSNKRSAAMGDTKAQTSLAWCYSKGFGTGKNMPEALKWYRKTADKGSVDAMLGAGYLYLLGKDVELNYVESFKFLSKAVDIMSSKSFVELLYSSHKDFLPEAQYNLGVMYVYGGGVDIDFVKAVDLFEKAANGGMIDAKVALCEVYCIGGPGVEKNFNKAYLHIKDAAEAGNGKAQCHLGDFYKDGIAVEVDLKKAFEWYSKSYGQGVEESIPKIAEAYFYGDGVEKNLNMAFEILDGADFPNNIYILGRLGVFYHNGIGTHKDQQKALECFKKSAALGSEWAQGVIDKYYSSEEDSSSGIED